MTSRTSRPVRDLSVFQASARAAGYCPTCIGRGRIVEPNGDSNPCTDCDGAGSWDMFYCLTFAPVRVRA